MTDCVPDRHHGIATTYRGRRYRSILEARWAAFLASANGTIFRKQQRVEYEPVELDGWIPDFGVFYDDTGLSEGAAHKNVVWCPCGNGYGKAYIEVKPVTELPEAAAAKMVRATPFDEHGISIAMLMIVGLTPDDAWRACGNCSDWQHGPFHDWRAAWDAACNATQWRGR